MNNIDKRFVEMIHTYDIEKRENLYQQLRDDIGNACYTDEITWQCAEHLKRAVAVGFMERWD